MDFHFGSALALALTWLDLVELGGCAAIPNGRPSRQFLRLFLQRTDVDGWACVKCKQHSLRIYLLIPQVSAAREVALGSHMLSSICCGIV